jgi:hypothetical protein
VAELADAHGSGPCTRKGVGVRVPSSAPRVTEFNQAKKTRISLDASLVNEVRQLGGHKTKTAAVTAVLQEYVQRQQQREIIKLFGTIDYDSSYDYKAARRRKYGKRS